MSLHRSLRSWSLQILGIALLAACSRTTEAPQAKADASVQNDAVPSAAPENSPLLENSQLSEEEARGSTPISVEEFDRRAGRTLRVDEHEFRRDFVHLRLGSVLRGPSYANQAMLAFYNKYAGYNVLTWDGEYLGYDSKRVDIPAFETLEALLERLAEKLEIAKVEVPFPAVDTSEWTLNAAKASGLADVATIELFLSDLDTGSVGSGNYVRWSNFYVELVAEAAGKSVSLLNENLGRHVPRVREASDLKEKIALQRFIEIPAARLNEKLAQLDTRQGALLRVRFYQEDDRKNVRSWTLALPVAAQLSAFPESHRRHFLHEIEAAFEPAGAALELQCWEENKKAAPATLRGLLRIR